MPKECKWDQSIGTAMRSSNGLQSHGIRFEGCSTWDSLGGPFFTFNSLCFWPKRSPVGPKQPHVTVTDLTSHHLATKKTSSKSVVFSAAAAVLALWMVMVTVGIADWGSRSGLGDWGIRGINGTEWRHWVCFDARLAERCDLDNKFLLHAIWWISHAQMNINTWRRPKRWTIIIKKNTKKLVCSTESSDNKHIGK